MSNNKKSPGPGGGPAMALMPGEKAKDFKKTIATLLGYFKPYRFKIILVLIFSIASTVFSIVSPNILGGATDIVVSGFYSGSGVDFKALLEVVLFLCVLYVISFLFSFLQGYIMVGVSQEITYSLRKSMSEKMDRLPLSYMDTKSNGEILSRVTNDMETVNQSLSQSITQIITSFTTLVGIVGMMLYISIPMTGVALIVLPISMLLIRLIVKFSQGHFKNQQKYLGEINGHVEEMYSGHLVVKAFNGEASSITKFNEINDKLAESALKSQFLSGLMMPLTGFVGNLAYVFVCVTGGYLALNGKVSIGNIQAFLQYVRSFNQPISQVANVANVLQSTAAAAERVFEFLNEKEEINKIEIIKDNNSKEVEGQVSFENISFGYDENNILIHNFSFTANPGQRIAIVGPTGAGKTTIMKLLMRFYELNDGRILIDSIDVKQYSRSQLRSMFSMVLQDTWLFSGTILDNIKYGNPNASKEDVIKAAKAAHIHHFIKTQPNGYDMIVNEDANNISQGQKQLITIARAILADSPILILDEATSSVDTRTELMIQNAMANLMHGRTSFIIAHRLSTIKNADLILVIKDGNIIEQGNHNQLMSQEGFYTNLYNSQY